MEEACDAILADIDNHMGSIFEQVCRDWVGRYSADPQLDGTEDRRSVCRARGLRSRHHVNTDAPARTGRDCDAPVKERPLNLLHPGAGNNSEKPYDEPRRGAPRHEAPGTELGDTEKRFHNKLIPEARRGVAQDCEAQLTATPAPILGACVQTSQRWLKRSEYPSEP